MINYRELYHIDPVFARKKLLESYRRTKSMQKTAAEFKTSKSVVSRAYSRYLKQGEKGLQDRSRRPRSSPKKTESHIEYMVIIERKRTGYGPQRLERVMRSRGIEIKSETIKKIIRRNKLTKKRRRTRYRTRRYYDFDSIYPLSVFEVDLKEVYDKRALPKDVIEHARQIKVPRYQWTAIDIKTRMRFISYSNEKTFSCGMVFIKSLIYHLRAMGINHKIIIKTDNGEEFGGKSIPKLEYLNKNIFSQLNAELLHIPKRSPYLNGFVERSHRTDDEELYLTEITRSQSKQEFLFRALRWLFFYNTKRFHQGISMTPFQKLKSYYPHMQYYISIFPLYPLDRPSAIPSLFSPTVPHLCTQYIYFFMDGSILEL